MRSRLSLAPILAILVGAVPISSSGAQEPARPTASPTESNPATPAAGHSVHGEAFNDGPRSSAYLMQGQGVVDFPVTTSRKDAQAFVAQGVAQLHTFYYLEAERSFRQAAVFDPDCPMAYWGMAMANVNNAKRAKGFLKEAIKKAEKTKVTRRERLYLDALQALHKDGVDGRNQKKNHLLALETLVQEFPRDLEARAWLAMVTWQNSSADGIGSRQAVDGLLESVLEKEPLHPGSHHYRIHLWDGVKPIRAEKAAALYAKAAPGIAHAWHMPGHTYTGLKRYSDAAYQQEGSARVDHAYMFHDRVMPFEIHNYAHNNQWLCTSMSHIGRARDAIAVARNLVEQPRDPNKNGPNDGGSPQRVGRLRWSEVLTRYELWDELIEATNSGALDWTDIPLEKREKAYTLGLAYAAKGDTANLDKQIAALKEMADKEAPRPSGSQTASSTTPASSNAPSTSATGAIAKAAGAIAKAATGGGRGFGQRSNAAPALAELEGYRLLSQGDHLAAIEKFKGATSMRQESLARAQLAAKNFGLAEAAARKAVADGENQAPPLVVLVEVLRAAGKDKEAREAYAKLVPLAREADADLPMFKRLAAITQAWKRSGTWTAPASESATDELIAVTRVDLDTVGPLGWTPNAAPPLSLKDTEGRTWSLADRKGKNVVLLFFLGGKCAHCMQQLQLFGKEIAAIEKLQAELVAVSTDDLEAARNLKFNKDDVKFPMGILPDPKLESFKRYRSFDDFENQPLHAIFLVDAQGNVRYQKVSADPFLDVAFVKGELARMNRLVKERRAP